MRPEDFVLPAPSIGQALRLGDVGEQLYVQDLIPESPVERLGNAVLPPRSWLDVARDGPAVLAPTLKGVFN